jgi:hypothetical protein
MSIKLGELGKLGRLGIRIGLVGILLLLTSAVYAQGGVPQHSDPQWHATYWNNVALSGAPAHRQTVDRIDFNWGYGSPHPAVASDRFSARWTRTVDLPAGTYRFTATSDDGIRVYVDGQAIIDQWRVQSAQTFTVDLTLAAGHHQVIVEYFEDVGLAVARVYWAPVTPTQHGVFWGRFYNNRFLNGQPVMEQQDARIDYDWGYGAPGPGMPVDNFSARWTGTFSFQRGTYRFKTTSDDGIRVWVDGRPIIDEWREMSASTFTADLDLAAGPHEVIVEYFEAWGAARVKVEWALYHPTGQGQWRGDYFDNPWLNGPPILTTFHEQIDFNWGDNAPAPGLPADRFSVRWTRTLSLPSGMYRFTTTTDDGVRLWVNGHALIDAWYDQSARSHSGMIHLAGDVPVVMEYYESQGAARARLAWTRTDGGPGPGPDPQAVIVDDGDPGFRQGGSTTSWRTAGGGYGNRHTWTYNNDRWRSNYNWARWYPNLTAGRYEVYVYIPPYNATTSNARYWVAHAGGFSRWHVNQRANAGSWVSLGIYHFQGQNADYVSLNDITYEPYLSTRLGFDAVKWVPR